MNWMDTCKKEANELTPERRQQVLDTIRRGKTIGQAVSEHSLPMSTVCGVINMNILLNYSLAINSK